VDWIHLVQDRVKRRAPVHTVKTRRLHKMRIIYRLAQKLFLKKDSAAWVWLVSLSVSTQYTHILMLERVCERP
jgi:hypothetical protein